MSDNQAVSGKFKLLFLFSFVCSSTATITQMTMTAMIMMAYWNPVAWLTMGGAWLVVVAYFENCFLTILVMRFQVIFGDSVYRMSKSTHSMFNGILVLLFVLPLLFPVLVVMAKGFNEDIDLSASGWAYTAISIVLFSFFALFLIASVLAVFHFVNNLRLLTKDRRVSPRARDSAGSGISLDRHQQKLSDLAARYLLLFGIAILTDILFVVGIGWSFSLSSGIRFVLSAADYTVNLMCEYLQFGFATTDYQRFCGCLDRVCRDCMSHRARTMIARDHDAKSAGIQIHCVVPNPNIVDGKRPQVETV